jgi:hypothetical protein
MGLLPIIIFVIIALIIRSVTKHAQPSSPSKSGGESLGDILQQAVRSASNEKWMAAAGALQARYQRPAQGRTPAIEGEYKGMQYQLFLAQPNARNVSCRIQFSQPLDRDLLIVHGRNEFIAKYFRDNKPPVRNTGLYSKHLGGSAADEQWFRKYLSKKDRVNVINGMTHYLLSFQISDTGISAVFENDENYPDVPMVKVLLQDAEQLVDDAFDNAVVLAEESEPIPEIVVEEDVKPQEVVIPKTTPSVPMPTVSAPKPITAAPMPEVSKPKPVFSAAPTMKPVTPAAPAKTAEVVELSMEQQAFCDTLFRKNVTGKTEKDLFASVIGQQVEWQGTLLSTYDFTFDFAFGNKKGVKASFLLCEVAANGSMKQKVKAHVAFPAGASSDLKQKRNQQLAFRGTLLKMESFSREIYIDNGELL